MSTDYKNYFKGKKVTQLGLGLLGRGVGDAAFLLESGVAELIVTDKKSEIELVTSVLKLKKASSDLGSHNGRLIFRLGEHNLEDFQSRDMVLKAAGTPLDSPFIVEAKKNNIPIEMDSSLFVKLLPDGVTTIGVTGTRGKSTVTHLINHILKMAGKSVFLGGNVRGVATLPLIKDVKGGDFVVLELDSWQLQGFGDSHISPNIAVFTAFMHDHMNYYNNDPHLYFNDKSNIYLYQNEGGVLIVGEGVAPVVAGKSHGKGKFIIAEKNNVPVEWKKNIIGEHNLLNISCAIEVCKAVGLNESDIKKGVESFDAVEGRLQIVKEIGGVKIYNDNNATTPEATVAAIRALAPQELRNTKYELRNEKPDSKFLNLRSIILICGGSDKGLPLKELIEEIGNNCKYVILLPGTGTDKFLGLKTLSSEIIEVKNLDEAVSEALKRAKKDDYVLFSPAFASFGMFKNEYERGDQFLEAIERFK